VGRIILVDPDKVELKNLNRIINSTVTDAEKEISKVEMLAAAAKRIG
jgi:tRNA A37 threonylcarbamoyladenosine dehydratase